MCPTTISFQRAPPKGEAKKKKKKKTELSQRQIAIKGIIGGNGYSSSGGKGEMR